MSAETQNYVEQLVKAFYSGPLEIKVEGSYVTIKVDNREKVKADLHAYLETYKYPYQDVKTSKSSFNGTSLKTAQNKDITIIYKSSKGGGSGAGAEVTELAESAQCWYTAIAFNYSIESYDDFLMHSSKVANKTDTDATLEKIKEKLPDDWVMSSIKIANYMKTMPIFTSNMRNFEFHRGSKTVDAINNMFLKVNRIERAFSDINKWNPADIWLMTAKGKKAVMDMSSGNKIENFMQLNKFIQEQYESKDLIGVSLKKVGSTVKSEVFNYERGSFDVQFSKFRISSTSKDGYISFTKNKSPMEIQFRSFTPVGSWQGEIKGATAAGGKIGGGVVAKIVQRVSGKSLSSLSANTVTQMANKNDPKLTQSIKEFASSLNVQLQGVELQSPDWKYSKYLTLELFSTINSLSATLRNKIMTEIIGYSSSATEYSSVFIKIS